jgi:hypothetical protein
MQVAAKPRGAGTTCVEGARGPKRFTEGRKGNKEVAARTVKGWGNEMADPWFSCLIPVFVLAR